MSLGETEVFFLETKEEVQNTEQPKNVEFLQAPLLKTRKTKKDTKNSRTAKLLLFEGIFPDVMVIFNTTKYYWQKNKENTALQNNEFSKIFIL